mmetsp:Transcript_31184/g.63758  ORF Transcript_31184/g.63758 Transcript_31184/m.63758 type:complete len:298 (+) Transcript_31184:687-1580(+)
MRKSRQLLRRCLEIAPKRCQHFFFFFRWRWQPRLPRCPPTNTITTPNPPNNAHQIQTKRNRLLPRPPRQTSQHPRPLPTRNRHGHESRGTPPQFRDARHPDQHGIETDPSTEWRRKRRWRRWGEESSARWFPLLVQLRQWRGRGRTRDGTKRGKSRGRTSRRRWQREYTAVRPRGLRRRWDSGDGCIWQPLRESQRRHHSDKRRSSRHLGKTTIQTTTDAENCLHHHPFCQRNATGRQADGLPPLRWNSRGGGGRKRSGEETISRRWIVRARVGGRSRCQSQYQYPREERARCILLS